VTLLAAACSRQEAAVSAPVASLDTDALHLRTFEALWSTVNDNYVYNDAAGVDWQAVRDEYLPGVEAGLGPDEFMATMQAMLAELPSEGAITLQTREERIQQAVTDSNTYGGIGAFVGVRSAPEPRVILLSVMAGSPAESAGLQTHDSILAIDGEPIRVEEGADVIMRVRGEAGSEVTLTVRSPGEAPRDVLVTRAQVQVSSIPLQWEALGDDEHVGYFLFPPTPYEAIVEDLNAAIESLSSENDLAALILDFRVTTARGDWPVDGFFTLFTDGQQGEFYSRSDSNSLVAAGEDFFNSQEIPLVAIVGPDTSGLPEIFIAALQATGRAVVVGDATPGEVEGTDAFFLPDGSRVFVPTSTYRTPDGREVGLLGIEPDVPVEADWDAITPADDPVLNAALEVLPPGNG
jgi:carboxyl-terminal processing protease